MRPDHSKEFLIRFLSCYAYFDGSATGRFRRIGIMIIARVVRLGLPSGLMSGQTRFTQQAG